MTIFVKTRHEYQSYWDFWELVRLSEFPTCFTDEIDWQSDNTYILTPLNGEIPNPLPEKTAKIIWWNIERPSWQSSWQFDRPDFDEIWVCDVNWAKETGSKYVLMGSHPGLGVPSAEKTYDYCTNSYDNPRRVAIWDALKDLKRAPNGWGGAESRSDRTGRSKLIVVPQQDDPPHAVTPLRFAIAAAYKLPMVYEGETDTHPFVDGVDFIHAHYDDIPFRVREALADQNLSLIGENLHQKLCVETNFRQEVEKLL